MKIALKILESQARKGEEININLINAFCNKEELIVAIQEELIDIAQTQGVEERRNTLTLARELTEENINSSILWKVLTNIEEVKIASSEAIVTEVETMETQQSEQNTTALERVNYKKSWLEKAKDNLRFLLKRTTVYTFGDINKDTGEWENIEIEMGKFPRKMSSRKCERLLTLEINDISEVVFTKILMQYKNLQRIEFGRGVHYIGKDFCYGFKRLREVLIGDGVYEIGERAFAGLDIEKINIPDSVDRIEEAAFLGCIKLKEVNLGNEVRKIGRTAFFGTEIEKIEIPGTVEKIGEMAFAKCRMMKEVIVSPYLSKEIQLKLNSEYNDVDVNVKSTSIEDKKNNDLGLDLTTSKIGEETINVPTEKKVQVEEFERTQKEKEKTKQVNITSEQQK